MMMIYYVDGNNLFIVLIYVLGMEYFCVLNNLLIFQFIQLQSEQNELFLLKKILCLNCVDILCHLLILLGDKRTTGH